MHLLKTLLNRPGHLQVTRQQLMTVLKALGIIAIIFYVFQLLFWLILQIVNEKGSGGGWVFFENGVRVLLRRTFDIDFVQGNIVPLMTMQVQLLQSVREWTQEFHLDLRSFQRFLILDCLFVHHQKLGAPLELPVIKQFQFFRSDFGLRQTLRQIDGVVVAFDDRLETNRLFGIVVLAWLDVLVYLLCLLFGFRHWLNQLFKYMRLRTYLLKLISISLLLLRLLPPLRPHRLLQQNPRRLLIERATTKRLRRRHWLNILVGVAIVNSLVALHVGED